MSPAIKGVGWLLVVTFLLTGCHPLWVETSPEPEGKSVLALHAIKELRSGPAAPTTQAPAYRYIGNVTFELFRDGQPAGEYVTTYEGPVEIRDLTPGTYAVRIRGRRFISQETLVDVKEGKRVDLKFSVRTARRNTQFGESVGATAQAIGTGVLYATFFSVYLIAAAVTHSNSDDDGNDSHPPCKHCGSRSHRDCRKHK